MGGRGEDRERVADGRADGVWSTNLRIVYSFGVGLLIGSLGQGGIVTNITLLPLFGMLGTFGTCSERSEHCTPLCINRCTLIAKINMGNVGNMGNI